MMDFDAITEFWFGDIPEPEFPLEPLDLGAGFPSEEVELVNPLELEFQPVEEVAEPIEEVEEATEEIPVAA